jgi:hypothetical protein
LVNLLDLDGPDPPAVDVLPLLKEGDSSEVFDDA